MKSAKDFINKVVPIRVKRYDRKHNNKMIPGKGSFTLKKSSAEIIVKNIGILNDKSKPEDTRDEPQNPQKRCTSFIYGGDSY